MAASMNETTYKKETLEFFLWSGLYKTLQYTSKIYKIHLCSPLSTVKHHCSTNYLLCYVKKIYWKAWNRFNNLQINLWTFHLMLTSDIYFRFLVLIKFSNKRLINGYILVLCWLFWSFWKFLLNCDVFPKEISEEFSLADELPCSLWLALHFSGHCSIQSTTIGNILKMSKTSQQIFLLQTIFWQAL